MATLKDVARKAEVTAAIVSNVLSGRVRVRATTRDKVLSAIAEVGYQPNLVARGLARGSTRTIAILVPSLTESFFAEVLEILEAAATIREYHLYLGLSHGNPQLGAHYIQRIADRWVDGYLIFDKNIPHSTLQTLAPAHQAIVLCGWGEKVQGTDVLQVDIDFVQAGCLAAQHVIDRGYRRIAFIKERTPQQARFEAFQSTLQHHAITLPTAYVRQGDSSFISGYREGRMLLTLVPRPTAIVTENDAMAFGVLQAATDLGIHIPAELAVVGGASSTASSDAHPPLTTMQLPLQELAHCAIESLLDGIASIAGPQYRLLAPHLVVRQST